MGGEYAELGNVTRASVKADEEEFIKVIEGRAKGADGKLKVVDVGKKEKDPGLVHNRVPVCNSAAPLEPDFDTICNALCGTNVNAPVIVNCRWYQKSGSRGAAAACLFREFQ